MTDPRRLAFLGLTASILLGTLYSVVYGTYLDTSNPLLTNLPHPLSPTHYWATKSNWLNVYFIKKAWGWTTIVFLTTYSTSPLSTRTTSRFLKFALGTSIWLIFTGWFFGPALLERVIASTGGECVLSLPSGDHISLPNEYCFTQKPVAPSDIPGLLTTSNTLLPADWSGKPRLRKGHDISGHLFLLTLSTLFIADQVRLSFRARTWTALHGLTIGLSAVLMVMWIFSTYITSVYFHSPYEKLTGYGTCSISQYVSASTNVMSQHLGWQVSP